MNILVVGCGKVGSRLANVLSRQGHDVSVISKEEANFERLSSDFNGFTTLGVPIDQDVLKKAGIENCDALAAVTEDDNVNIMVCQLAREIFNVQRVLARIYDPIREDVFSQFGLHTICPTNMTVEGVCAYLSEHTDAQSVHFGATTVSFYSMDIPREYIGARVSAIEFEPEEVLYAVERETKFILVGLQNLFLQKGDKLIFSKRVD